MSNMPWFRAYIEMVDDEKLCLLAFESRWQYVALLCLKGQGVLDSEDTRMLRRVAVKLGLDLRTLDEVMRRLSEVGLIDQETLQPLAWDKRQMKSDSSAERVARFRARKKQEQDSNVSVTLPKRPGNALDKEGDTEKINTHRKTSALEFSVWPAELSAEDGKSHIGKPLQGAEDSAARRSVTHKALPAASNIFW